MLLLTPCLDTPVALLFRHSFQEALDSSSFPNSSWSHWTCYPSVPISQPQIPAFRWSFELASGWLIFHLIRVDILHIMVCNHIQLYASVFMNRQLYHRRCFWLALNPIASSSEQYPLSFPQLNSEWPVCTLPHSWFIRACELSPQLDYRFEGWNLHQIW